MSIKNACLSLNLDVNDIISGLNEFDINNNISHENIDLDKLSILTW